MTDPNDRAWFAPHRWGYGAGFPIVWQGWLLMALQLAAVGWGVTHFSGNEDRQLVVVLLAIFVPLPLIMAKTRGGWRWRWGDND